MYSSHPFPSFLFGYQIDGFSAMCASNRVMWPWIMKQRKKIWKFITSGMFCSNSWLTQWVYKSMGTPAVPSLGVYHRSVSGSMKPNTIWGGILLIKCALAMEWVWKQKVQGSPSLTAQSRTKVPDRGCSHVPEATWNLTPSKAICSPHHRIV